MAEATHPPVVFARFTGETILGEMGRLLYAILNVFSNNGYRVLLFNDIDFSKLDKYGQRVPDIENLSLVDSVPGDTGQMFYLFDGEDRACSGRPWKKKIRVGFDVFATYWFTDPLIMPYPVHPLLSGADLPDRLDRLRQNRKSLRLFFSGDTKNYFRNRVHYPNSKLPRLEVIGTLLEDPDIRPIHADSEITLRNRFEGEHSNDCVIVDTDKMWIDPSEWLPYMSKSDFFICPPGYTMPMCHNVVEAMAVGTIPVINYPEWFNPTLKHMENCIVFGDRADLVDRIKAVLAMDQAEVDELRKRVIDYYENHLNPGKFIRQIETRKEHRLTVLMITDENTIRNASRINGKSILIRGKPLLADSSLYRLVHAWRTR